MTESRSVVAWRWAEKWYCCGRGHPFQGLKGGSYLTLGIELSKETCVLRMQETALERVPGQRAGGSGNPGGLLCHVAHSLWFYGEGISFRLWPVILMQGPSWLGTRCSASMDAKQEEFWEVVGHMASPFDLSQILPVGCGFLIPCCLSGLPVIK